MNNDTVGQSPDTSTIFDLSLPDSDLISLIRRPLQDSQKYWDDDFGLKKAREIGKNMWLPNHWQNEEVYDYQRSWLYQEPKIFEAVETICAVVNSRIAQPEVMPAQDTVISRQMAKDVQAAMFAHAEKYRVADIFRIAARNLLLKRVGYVKLRWDPNLGQFGDVVPEHVMPEEVVVDQDARWNETPRFTAFFIKNKTAEELLALFPDAYQGIAKLIGTNRTDSKGNKVIYKSMLGKKLNLWEVWFRYYDKEAGRYGGGVAWVSEKVDIILGKMRNPNWNYDDDYEAQYSSNLLDFPQPPLMTLNYLNDGSSYIDTTSMVEQAATMQRILDRRGFQIMENAEQSGSGLVFNTQMIRKSDIGQLVGSPDERIGVKGDVRAAVQRVSPPLLPQWVIEDRQDLRDSIDNVFATHDITRGQNSDNKTLGQDQIQMSQDYTRMDDIARAIERMAAQYYRYLVQMWKVYYTEDHWFKATGEDGQFDYIVMRHDLIEDGIDVRVAAGSTLPINKSSQQKIATDLAQLEMIDPLTLYEVATGAPMPSPSKMMERFMLYKTDPGAFMNKVQDDDFDREAFMDIQILNGGEMPKERDEVTPNYLKFMNNYMVGGEFAHLKDSIKALYVKWMTQVKAQVQQQLQMAMTQLPTPQEMQQSNQRAVQQAGVEQQLAVSQGGPPGGPAGPGGPPPPPSAPAPQALAGALAGRGPAVTPPVA